MNYIDKKYLIIILAILLFDISAIASPEYTISPYMFKSDEKLIKYPYDLNRLKREGVIVGIVEETSIAKIYRYDDDGNLIAIHLPQLKFSLFIEKKQINEDRFLIEEGNEIYPIVGGNFQRLDFSYRGGAGISDAAAESYVLDKIIKTSQNSISKLKEAINIYKEESGHLLIESDFDKPIDLNHPLMAIKNMNLSYFFDGHGNRLVYKRNNDQFEILSPTLSRDLKKKSDIERQFTELDNLGIIILLILVGGIIVLSVILIKWYRKKKESGKNVPT